MSGRWTILPYFPARLGSTIGGKGSGTQHFLTLAQRESRKIKKSQRNRNAGCICTTEKQRTQREGTITNHASICKCFTQKSFQCHNLIISVQINNYNTCTNHLHFNTLATHHLQVQCEISQASFLKNVSLDDLKSTGEANVSDKQILRQHTLCSLRWAADCRASKPYLHTDL